MKLPSLIPSMLSKNGGKSMHTDEKGRISPAKSLVAKSMRARKEHKIEKVRKAEPKYTEEEGFKDVEKSGRYRRLVARGLKQSIGKGRKG